MFEKRSIWGIIVGLNVCVLIWLISVQEPVMYDANSAVIISGSFEQQQQQLEGEKVNGNELYEAGEGGGGIKGFDDVVPSLRMLREDRDVNDKEQRQRQQQQQRPLYTSKHNDVTSTLTTLNISTKSSSSSNTSIKNINSSTKYYSKTKNINSTKSSQYTNLESLKIKRSKAFKEMPQIIADSDSDTTTLSTNTLSSSVAGDGMQHSLTSSLGTGLHDFRNVKPTPSWKALTAVSSALPNEDFNNLIDLQHFHYLVPQPVCSTDIEALILVHSAPRNFEKRRIIRETWASIGRHRLKTPLRVLFLLGAVYSETTQKSLLRENNEYADIIQGSFIDAYRNMTYKHVMAFKWFLYNCPQAQILIKVDDDIYVNTPRIMRYIRAAQRRRATEERQEDPTILTNNTTSNTSPAASTPSKRFNAAEDLFNRPQNLLFCELITGATVKRSFRSKWRVSFQEFAGYYYPPYCPGYAIIYSPDVVFRLYTAAQKSKYFWIDDVHITGVMAQKTQTKITTSSYYILHANTFYRLIGGRPLLKDVDFLFAWPSMPLYQSYRLWRLQLYQEGIDDDQQYELISNKTSSSSSSSSLPSALSSSNNISNYSTPVQFR